jgi:hypothetical protein
MTNAGYLGARFGLCVRACVLFWNGDRVCQLDGAHLIEPDMRKRFLGRYPEKAGELMPPVEPGELRAHASEGDN